LHFILYSITFETTLFHSYQTRHKSIPGDFFFSDGIQEKGREIMCTGQTSGQLTA